MYSIVIVIIGAVAIWGLMQYKHSMNLRQELDNQYNRAFFDMVGYVDNVEALLAKSIITSTPSRTASTLQEAWRQANFAQSDLGQLPVSQQVLANTSKFLTQVGDLSYSLNNQNMQGKPLDDKQTAMIEQLHKLAVSLKTSLADLQSQLSAGRLKWGALESKGPQFFQNASKNVPAQSFVNMDKTFKDYPTLIYDGPFSDNLTKLEPKGVGKKTVSLEDAKKAAEKFFGADRIQTVDNTGKNDQGQMKTYSFKVLLKGAPSKQTASIDITQLDGRPYWMIYNRPVGQKNLSPQQAIEMGRKFLDSRGFPDMKETYYLSNDNTLTVNYAYLQQNVIIYPDLIKLKIALDNGEVVGFEAKAYLFAHSKRDIPAPKISMEQAKAKINKKLKITGQGLAIIPTDFKTELFTYEFKGKLENQDFLVYINALTGLEEDVLLIVNTPNGTLTM